MKLSLSKTYNNVRFFRWKKYCSNTVQVWNFVDTSSKSRKKHSKKI